MPIYEYYCPQCHSLFDHRARRIGQPPPPCPGCGALALNAIRQGLATKVRILVAHDACPICRHFEGAYDFDHAPELPLEGCSRPGGCNAVYAPVLDRFGP